MTWHWHLLFFLGWISVGIISSSFPTLNISFLFFPLIPIFWVSVPIFFAGKAFVYSSHHGASLFSAFINAIIGFFHYPKFLWSRRLTLNLPSNDIQTILKESVNITKVFAPDSLFCPFCNIEIPQALRLVSGENITTTKRPMLCPRCGLRFDCCRYCQNYEMSGNQSWIFENSHGKCKVIKEVQNIDSFCDPSMAKRLHDMGWDSLYTGLSILDNFTPPDRCRQFILDGEKTKIDHIPGMGKIRIHLMKLQKKQD
ncbi:MAG TPA: hypothetical protein DCY12_02970 [Candidatus Atribacteria bacterium]|nr:hypothetical protein [Candidatus Atribacteria bacterium]HCU22610.1 hypothetical protein [Candidatus Atribacteria bacterium]